uniref:Prolyl 4-hydroxylase subunit alpha 3 n=1 Tax=Anser cygnoides TaxID=8845 RepID=A0A8B9ENA8_ANSCY
MGGWGVGGGPRGEEAASTHGWHRGVPWHRGGPGRKGTRSWSWDGPERGLDAGAGGSAVPTSPPGRTLWVLAHFSLRFWANRGVWVAPSWRATRSPPPPHRFYEKVRALHQDPGASVDNPLLAFSLIKRLSSDWPRLVYSDEATENTRGTAPLLHPGSGGASPGPMEKARGLQPPLRPPPHPLPSSPRWFQGGTAGAARSRGPGRGGAGADAAAGRLRAQRQGHGQRRLPARRHRPPAPLQPRPPRRALRRRLLPCGQGGLRHGRLLPLHRVAGGGRQPLPPLLRQLEPGGGAGQPGGRARPPRLLLLHGTAPGPLPSPPGPSRGPGAPHTLSAPTQAGNISHALTLSKEFLHYDPSNQRVTRNVAKYKKLLATGGDRAGGPLRRPNATRLQSRDAYEELCQSLGAQPAPERPPHLGCSYETNGSPYLLLQPAKKETLRLRPYVALYHDFVSDAEAETIKGLAGPWLQRSVVASGEKQQKAEYRISKSAWLKDTADPVVRALELRMAAVTGLDLRPPYAEYLQVVNYGLGGHYEPHFDHATSRKSPLYRMKSGNRIATVMIYLSAVEAGGSTAFIYANFSVPVVKNAALFWWNLRRNGDGDGDTLHAGCPVLAGDKWGETAPGVTLG